MSVSVEASIRVGIVGQSRRMPNLFAGQSDLGVRVAYLVALIQDDVVPVEVKQKFLTQTNVGERRDQHTMATHDVTDERFL